MKKASQEQNGATPGPTRAIVAYAEGVSRKDVIELAKGYALKFFASPNTCRFCVVAFMGGWLYEVHEANAAGRRGKGHLSAIVAALNEGAECAWFRVDGRVFSVSIKDARPYGVLLAPQQGASLVKTSPELEVRATDAMQDVVAKGEKVLATGVAMFFVGSSLLGMSLAYDIATKVLVPPPPGFSVVDAPHRQWDKLSRTPKGLFVESMRYDASRDEGSRWAVARKPVVRETTAQAAPVDMGAAQPIPASGSPTPAQPIPLAQPVPMAEPVPVPMAQPAPVQMGQPLPVPMAQPIDPVASSLPPAPPQEVAP